MLPIKRNSFICPLIAMFGVAFTLCFGATAVQASAIQVPAGLKAGDQFRIIFVTSGKTAATSDDISYYNEFVNAQAGGVTFHGAVVNWSAVGSTNTVDALDNINSLATAPVYMMDGTLVATGTTPGLANGLWSSDLLAAPTQGIDGTDYSGETVWTGTAGNGIHYNTAKFGSYGLGSNNQGFDPDSGTNIFSEPQVQIGLVSGTGSSWVQVPNLSATNTPGLNPWTNEYQMYGISAVLTVVPEPSTLLLAGFGFLVLGGMSLRRRLVVTAIE